MLFCHGVPSIHIIYEEVLLREFQSDNITTTDYREKKLITTKLDLTRNTEH